MNSEPMLDQLVEAWQINNRATLKLIAALSDDALHAALEESANAIETTIRESWANGGKIPSFKRGLIPMIGYLIAHESHHRGSIMLTLKQSSVGIPEELKWALWDWAKL
jgi:uncharacterized damage-inducible protein DinB